MKEKYNHEALNKKLEELSLPDEEQSWQKMKALLDREEENDRILPPFFLTCAGWALLILFIAGGVFIFWPSNEDSISKTDPTKKKEISAGNTPQLPQVKTSSDSNSDTIGFSSPSKIEHYQIPLDQKNKNLKTKVNNKIEEKKRTGAKRPVLLPLKKNTDAGTPQPSVNSPINENPTQTVQDKTSDSIITKKDSVQIKDTAALETIDKDSLVVEKKIEPKEKKNQNFYFAAGLSLQQQLPIGGQSLTPYSAYGRKSSLSNYLPAIYLRFYKENRWSLQVDFRYGAPQATKELSYRSTTTRDSMRRTTTSATLRLKKTFYHQLPFSFNYSPFPDFSFGAGGMYSRFESAVSENELKVRNNQTNTETVTRRIIKIPSTTDSVFTASQWNYLLQAEYSWKKWGAGFRYTGGLQPFIRYTENGIKKEEKNHSLQVFLRYDFLKRQL